MALTVHHRLKHAIKRLITRNGEQRLDKQRNREVESTAFRTPFLRSPFSVLVISATLILFPIALSPVSSDPAGAGRLALLLAANFILYLILAAKQLMGKREQRTNDRGELRTDERMNGEEGERMTDKQINGEEALWLRSFVLSPQLSLLLALVLTLTLLLISPNRTVALAGQGAKVIPVLLFYLAARRLLYGNSIVTNIFFSVIPANAGIQNGSNSIDSGSMARNDKKEDGIKEGFGTTKGLSMVKKAWVTGLVIFGLLYLLFASPLSRRLAGDPVSDPSSKQTVVLNRYYQTATALAGPQFNLTRPDWQTSLKVAVETLAHSSLTGAGLGRYSGAFSAYRGSAFNYTPIWNLKFTTSFSTLFNWVTEGGMIGALVYVLIFLPGFTILFATTKKVVAVIPICQLAERNLPRMRARTSREILRRGLLRMTTGFLSLKSIITGLTVVSLFFSFGLAEYFYMITGYLLLEGDGKG